VGAWRAIIDFAYKLEVADFIDRLYIVDLLIDLAISI